MRLLMHIDKQRFSAEIQCSYEGFYQGGSFYRVFLLRFHFQIHCSCLNYNMTSIILLTINSGKRL